MRLSRSNNLTDNRLLFAYWANNKGRGNSNCTLIVVPAGTERTGVSKPLCCAIDSGEIDGVWLRTSSWEGNVNVSHDVCRRLGIKKSDITIINEPKSWIGK